MGIPNTRPQTLGVPQLHGRGLHPAWIGQSWASGAKLVDGRVAFVEWSEWRIPAPPPAGSTWKCGAEGDEAVAAPGGSGGDPPRPTPPCLHWQHSPARRVSSWRCRHRCAGPALRAPTRWALASASMSGTRCPMASPTWPPTWRWMTALAMRQRTAQRESLYHCL